MAEMSAVVHEDRASEIPSHPLDPLTPGELEAVVKRVREARGLDHRHLFVTVQLSEPDKQTVMAWSEGDPLDRAAWAKDVDGAPIRQRGRNQAGDSLERDLVIERSRKKRARFTKKTLGFGAALLMIDVGAGSDPIGNLSLRVENRKSSTEMP
jgi:Cu2+-containing amine oxidase